MPRQICIRGFCVCHIAGRVSVSEVVCTECQKSPAPLCGRVRIGRFGPKLPGPRWPRPQLGSGAVAAAFKAEALKRPNDVETRSCRGGVGKRITVPLRNDGWMESSSRIHLDLETERLHLRSWITGDTSWHRHLVGERGRDAPTVEADAAVIAGVVDAQSAHGVVPSVVVRKADGEVLGYCGLVIGRATIDEPELAYELFQHAHGSGYATEAAVAVVAAAKQAGRSRLWSTVRIWNAPSFRVLEKLGFTRHHGVWDDNGELVWNVLDLR